MLKPATEQDVRQEEAELGIRKLRWCDDVGIMNLFLMPVLVLQQC